MKRGYVTVALVLVVLVLSIVSASAQRLTPTQQRLLRVARRVNAAVQRAYPDFGRGGRQLQFGLANSNDLNAMAYPDGRIYVTTGMMSALANRPDDELAAIVGHEATHVAQGHAASQAGRQAAGAIIGSIIGKAIGGSRNSGARWGSAISGAAYSRDDEYRADAGSVRLLRIARYSPNAMANVLRLLESRYGRGNAKTPVIGWFASHPDTGKRIENAQRAAQGRA